MTNKGHTNDRTRAIAGETEFFKLFDKIDLEDDSLSTEEKIASFNAFCMIVLEADTIGLQIVEQEKLLSVRETAKRMGLVE